MNLETITALIIGIPAVITALLNLARAIARLTPTEKDDVFIAKHEDKLSKLVDFLTKLVTILPDNKKTAK